MQFDSGHAEEFILQCLIWKSRGMECLVIDLRDNPVA